MVTIILGDPVRIRWWEIPRAKLPGQGVITMDLAEHGAFLPKVLVDAGVFRSTSEVKRIDRDRQHIIEEKGAVAALWRTVKDPEATRYKIGKRSFWLFVGDPNEQASNERGPS